MIIRHTAEEWRGIRARLQTIVNDPSETIARRAEARRILTMRPHVQPAQADADLFAIEYGL
ncbi:hypothetical protein NQ152_10270 [Microbacterium sp. zg.B48]|uniref:hypothetical protein n=1 Tax=unclassified Microbacterium TaxID=2609290 RepID=UPI00214C6CBB|nr:MULTISPECIES: hypothetical protein [unclassified Microbacterium]MCR2763889.1 hypothetical protein [Microbacterium sp. zg.B48]MCR2810311.1 hypothetical protein [Microbacterium sp. zg.B185]WIM18372.1 hypothetical protein QNO12_12285 [Microbacterium sp. zg-B185]